MAQGSAQVPVVAQGSRRTQQQSVQKGHVRLQIRGRRRALGVSRQAPLLCNALSARLCNCAMWWPIVA